VNEIPVLLPEESDLVPYQDRRVSVRFDCDEEAICHLSATRKMECRWARVRDVSEAGVGLRISAPLQPGRRLSREPTAHGSYPRRVFRAHVVHCTTQGDGSWLIGCRFDSPLPADAVRVLTEGAAEPANPGV